MSDFLNNLKESLDNGDFNSEGAANINKISELAESKMGRLDAIRERLEVINSKIAPVEKVVADAQNAAYADEIKKLEAADAVLAKLAQAFQLDEDLTNEIEAIDAAKISVKTLTKDLLVFIETLTSDLEGVGAEYKESIAEIKKKYENLL
jgi:chromosome segregation ATPase